MLGTVGSFAPGRTSVWRAWEETRTPDLRITRKVNRISLDPTLSRTAPIGRGCGAAQPVSPSHSTSAFIGLAPSKPSLRHGGASGMVRRDLTSSARQSTIEVDETDDELDAEGVSDFVKGCQARCDVAGLESGDR